MSQPSFEDPSGVDSTPYDQFDPATETAPTFAKQALNIYTLMLILSFLALLAGTILLLVELSRWGKFPSEFPWDTQSVQPNISCVQPWEPADGPTLIC